MSVEAGKIKWFDAKKGYGFIEAANGDSVFFDYIAVASMQRKLNPGQEVNYKLLPGDEVKIAARVKFV